MIIPVKLRAGRFINLRLRPLRSRESFRSGCLMKFIELYSFSFVLCMPGWRDKVYCAWIGILSCFLLSLATAK